MIKLHHSLIHSHHPLIHSHQSPCPCPSCSCAYEAVEERRVLRLLLVRQETLLENLVANGCVEVALHDLMSPDQLGHRPKARLTVAKLNDFTARHPLTSQAARCRLKILRISPRVGADVCETSKVGMIDDRVDGHVGLDRRVRDRYDAHFAVFPGVSCNDSRMDHTCSLQVGVVSSQGRRIGDWLCYKRNATYDLWLPGSRVGENREIVDMFWSYTDDRPDTERSCWPLRNLFLGGLALGCGHPRRPATTAG
jgi:hypothetical protein